MAENKMQKVAAMFGKKLGENFRVEYIGRKDICEMVKFTQNGLINAANVDRFEDDLFIWLLTGEAVITNE